MIHPLLTSLDLAHFIREAGIAAELIPMTVDTPTVPAAAAALGVPTAQIIKSLLFEIGGEPHLVIAGGDALVDRRILADRFGVGKKQVKLATAAAVLTRLGYPAGGVPPFGHVTRVPVLLDRSVARWDVVYGGGGDDRTMLRLTPAELLRVTNAAWIDLAAATSAGEAAP